MAAARHSAGLLVVREIGAQLEYFLVHPGGPFFSKRDDGAWSIPKGLVDPGEDPLSAAKRELTEETGIAAPPGPYLEIGRVKQKGGKIVDAWAVRADFDPSTIVSNTFELEWPPRSGRMQHFPEVDRGAFFDFDTAKRKINEAQRAFLERAAVLFAPQA